MFLYEFLADCEYRYDQDDDAVIAAEAAEDLVQLIRTGYDVSDFFELIMTETINETALKEKSYYENKLRKEIPF